jgi:hypothetical protein
MARVRSPVRSISARRASTHFAQCSRMQTIYGLKWVFVRDHYYDPLLSFAGWRPVDSLEDKTITVWSKDGVPPATPDQCAANASHWQGLMWGILPFGSSLLAILVF